MGAFFSFTCGHFGSRGGFGLQSGKPGDQNLYIGVKDGDRFSDAPLKCLPFFEGADADEAARFDVEKKSGEPKKSGISSYRRDEIQRHYGWATDKWVTPDFTFSIYTPFTSMIEPGNAWSSRMRDDYVPAIRAELEIDNTSGKTAKTGIFAVKFAEPGWRPIQLLNATGFAVGNKYGALGQVDWQEGRHGTNTIAPDLFCRWSPDGGLRQGIVHLLGNCPVLSFDVPAGQKRTLRLSLGSFVSDSATTGIAGEYLYKRCLSSLEDVLSTSLGFAFGVPQAKDLDAELLNSGLSPDQQFMIAHATRSYYGSTQLLDVGGEPFWVVNEGEYCMMNTLDLSVDHVFWELKQNPWVIKNLLDNFVRHYSYVDTVGGPGEEKTRPGGISFCHDMGVHNNFSPKGHSSYELPNLNALCFSYMTAEQLCNWILIAASYVAKTNDLEWAKQNQHIIEGCLQSLINRTDANGFPAFDSSRCAKDGAEITTYDSLDHSLAQTRNNLYMAVKAWASFRGLELLLSRLGNSLAESASGKAAVVEKELPGRADSRGIFPAVFEKENSGYSSRILPAIEGLMYPLYWGTLKPSPFVDALKKHTVALLKDGQNVFPDGGIKLSSTSNNSWMSKIAIFMHLCRKVFKLHEDPQIKELFAKADAAHVKWQTEGESAYWACSDQFVSGVAKGSKYYPRIITSALWME